MNKPQLKELLSTWTEKQSRVNKLNEKRDRQLEPLVEAYERKAEPINAAIDAQLETVLAERDSLEAEIRAAMLAEVKADGTTNLREVETEKALAILTTEKRREIEPAAFMRAVPPPQRRDPGYISCFSVLIGKAEKFLDQKTLARIVRPKLTHSVTVTLKSD